MQMQSQSKKEVKLLKTIIEGIRQDTRISNVIIYGDFNLNLSNRKNKKMIEKLEAFLHTKQLFLHKTGQSTRQEMKYKRVTKTQVDFFISSFQNEKTLSVTSISRDPEMRGSDHFPIQMVIQLEEAPELTQRMIVNRKQLDLITEKTQKFLRSKPHNAEEIKERLLAI